MNSILILESLRTLSAAMGRDMQVRVPTADWVRMTTAFDGEPRLGPRQVISPLAWCFVVPGGKKVTVVRKD